MCLSPEQMMVTMALKVVVLSGGSYWVVFWQFQKNLYLVFFTGKGKVLRGNSGSPYCVMRQVLVRIVGSQITSIVFMLLDKNGRDFWRLSQPFLCLLMILSLI